MKEEEHHFAFIFFTLQSKVIRHFINVIDEPDEVKKVICVMM
jgi:hypothetical protein